MDWIEISVQRLIDLSLEVGMVPDAKFHYRFDELSRWQMESLCALGMEPRHRLLDVGCGPLRLGIQAINYLDDGNYCGIDAYPPFHELGKRFYAEARLTKQYRVVLSSTFEFDVFARTFDYAIAQSVFTHLSKEQIRLCLRNLKRVMNHPGIFLFTNIQSDYPRGFLYGGVHPMITGAFCTPSFYRGIAAELDIEFVENTVSHPTQTAHYFRF